MGARVSKVHVTRRVAAIIALVTLWTNPAIAQKSAGPANGTLIVDGGGTTEPIVRRFVELAGGPQARIVVIATAPSSIRFGADNVILDPDWPRDSILDDLTSGLRTYKDKARLEASHLLIQHGAKRYRRKAGIDGCYPSR